MDDGGLRSTQNICTPTPSGSGNIAEKKERKNLNAGRRGGSLQKCAHLNVLNTAIVKQLYPLAVSLDKSPNGQLWMGKGLIGLDVPTYWITTRN